MSETSPDLSNKNKRALGRGLGSLLGGAEVPTSAPSRTGAVPGATVASQAQPAPTLNEGRVWQVGIDKLKSGVYQPRKNFEKEPLQELAQSIRENGILQPIIVRKTPGGSFEIVAGERRWRAAQQAGLHEVPVLIRHFEDQQALELAIVENIQREDLNPIEEAEAFSRLVADFHLSQQQVADKVGKERATVANMLRLLGLPADVRELVATGKLSSGHAKVLLSLHDPKKQSEFAKRVLSEKLPVRKLERLIAADGAPKVVPDLVADKMNQLVSALGGELQKVLATKVQIDYSEGKGQIRIAFYSNEELNQIVDRLKAGAQR